MKKLFTLLTAVLFTATINSQSPDKLSYQAVVRNSGDALVQNASVGFQISILQGSAGGTAVFVETHTVTTNANGLATLEIGGGTPVTGTFAGIDWSAGPYFLKTETDPAGGTSYTITGTSQLHSVPFALYSKETESVSGTNNYIPKFTTASTVGNSAIVETGGNVGIGTASPGAMLHVNPLASGSIEIARFSVNGTGGTGFSYVSILPGSDNFKTALRLHTNNTGANYHEIKNNGGVLEIATNDFNPIQLMTNALPRVYIDAAGNIGIGTIAPTEKLSIVGNIKIIDGSQGAGKVLTSDANGVASWAASSSGVNADWNAVGGLAEILNKPVIPTNTNQLTNGAGFITSETDPDWSAASGNYYTATYTDASFAAISHPHSDATTSVSGFLSGTDKTKLDNIASGAEVNVNSDWDAVTGDAQILNKPILETVATSGNFSDLSNIPTTISGYGITDAVTTAGNQTISGDKTFSNKIVVSQQGIGTATPSASAALEISSTTKGFLPPRMTQVERDALNPVEGLIVYNSTTKKPNYYDGTEWKNYDGSPAKTLAIGVSHQGGKIAYIFQSGDPGYVEGEVHGIIAALTDLQSPAPIWGCDGTLISGADGTAIGTGMQNTIDIVNGCSTEGTAAKLCSDLVLNGYDDWYLPSKDELNLLYLSKTIIGGFIDNGYWASTEFDSNHAMAQVFGNSFFGPGYQTPSHKVLTQCFVRPVRSF